MTSVAWIINDNATVLYPFNVFLYIIVWYFFLMKSKLPLSPFLHLVQCYLTQWKKDLSWPHTDMTWHMGNARDMTLFFFSLRRKTTKKRVQKGVTKRERREWACVCVCSWHTHTHRWELALYLLISSLPLRLLEISLLGMKRAQMIQQMANNFSSQWARVPWRIRNERWGRDRWIREGNVFTEVRPFWANGKTKIKVCQILSSRCKLPPSQMIQE